MPIKKIDYSLNVIYKVYCKDPMVTDIYIGRTTKFNIRKSQHKKCANDCSSNGFLYKCINENGGWENWDMDIIENYPCDNSVDACKREQYWINTKQATLNVVIDFDKNNLYKREWYFSQKLKINEKISESNRVRVDNKEKKRQETNYWKTIYYTNTNPEWYINNKKYWKKIQKIKNKRNNNI